MFTRRACEFESECNMSINFILNTQLFLASLLHLLHNISMLTWLIWSGRLSLVLLAHFPNLQLQTLFRGEDVTVRHLRIEKENGKTGNKLIRIPIKNHRCCNENPRKRNSIEIIRQLPGNYSSPGCSGTNCRSPRTIASPSVAAVPTTCGVPSRSAPHAHSPWHSSVRRQSATTTAAVSLASAATFPTLSPC